MLEEILWKNQNKRQVFGAAVGSLVGLLLLLLAFHTYLDLKNLLSGNSNDSGNFVLINKQVNLLNTFGVKNAFSEQEIDDIQSQSFVKQVGPFIPNQFKVSASSSTLGFYTELFFEAVPDEFLDFDISGFSWRPGMDDIPIVMSRDYLALYNFGFAPSQGLPQFTQNTIRKVSFTITLQGNGFTKQFRGRIVDFSDRINTILVPRDFMVWANRQFGGQNAPSSSRLILEVTNPASEALQSYFKSKGYEVSSGKLIGGKLQTAVRFTFTIVAGLGILIFMLSVMVFILNFQLLISRSKERIILLLQLGYRSKVISEILIKSLTKWFSGILLVAIILLMAIRFLLTTWLDKQGYSLSNLPDWRVWIVLLFLGVSFYWYNRSSIRTSIEDLT